jgi:hypothetical protein
VTVIESTRPNRATQALYHQQRARHAEIARRYAWHFRKSKRKLAKDDPRFIAMLRLCDLEPLYRRRYGLTLPYDDSGIDDLTIAAHHIANLGGDALGHIIAWARMWIPQMPRAEVEALAAQVIAEPHKFKAATLGWRLRLTETEREELGITTIEAIGVTPAKRAATRRRRQRERMAKHRERHRASKPAPFVETQPWQAFGMSRATWYRKGKPMPENRPETRETKSVRTSKSHRLIGAHEFRLTSSARGPKAGLPRGKRHPRADRALAARSRLLPKVNLEAISPWLIAARAGDQHCGIAQYDNVISVSFGSMVR